jgi:hypothetical protein
VSVEALLKQLADAVAADYDDLREDVDGLLETGGIIDGGSVVGPPVLAEWVQLTQAQYDALPVKDSATMYVIIG